jgi:hypothetical protein
LVSRPGEPSLNRSPADSEHTSRRSLRSSSANRRNDVPTSILEASVRRFSPSNPSSAFLVRRVGGPDVVAHRRPAPRDTSPLAANRSREIRRRRRLLCLTSPTVYV